jgi:CRP-like cAMP-binding protein
MLQSPHSSNLLLASLPPESVVALMPHLRVVELPQEAVLFEAGDTIKALYFPHNGIVSILVDLTSGEMIETAMIGRDSLVGGSAAVESRRPGFRNRFDCGGRHIPRARTTKPEFTPHPGAPSAVYFGASTAIRSLPCRSQPGGTALALVTAMP